MNRLVLIGNGFDLAHGLKTSYANFIDWYWEQRARELPEIDSKFSEDPLCIIESLTQEWSKVNYRGTIFSKKEWWPMIYKDRNKYKEGYKIEPTTFMKNILHSIETKRWVDIEIEYYKLLTEYALTEEDCEGEIDKLNEQLKFIQNKLIDYLGEIKISDSLLKPAIRQKIYAPIKQTDISIEGQECLKKHIEDELGLNKDALDYKLQQYGSCYSSRYVEGLRENYSEQEGLDWDCVPKDLLFPNQIMLLNFNYTHTAHLYCKAGSIFNINQIHGDVEEPDSIIFGYGDELDEDYKEISELNDNKLLANIKSIKYLEADKYRKMLAFIESEPYQVLIMGHSCGNSDRTLLNKIFEHKNCVSIKPYYYIKEDGGNSYLELVQNIHRNFTDMNLMRDRVVNKLYCETLT